jgi:hypothetical protein
MQSRLFEMILLSAPRQLPGEGGGIRTANLIVLVGSHGKPFRRILDMLLVNAVF